MAMNGEIMEISGLGQPVSDYTSYLNIKLTKGGRPVKGTFEFYDEDGKKIAQKDTDASGTLLATFNVPKITRIYVTVPGMYGTKTVPGMTVDNAAEARQDINTVKFDLPVGGGGEQIAAFWDGMSTMEKALLVGGVAAVVGLITIIALNKRSSPMMQGLGAIASWCCGDECE